MSKKRIVENLPIIKVYKKISTEGYYYPYNSNEKEFYRVGDNILCYNSEEDLDFNGDVVELNAIKESYSSPHYQIEMINRGGYRLNESKSDKSFCENLKESDDNSKSYFTKKEVNGLVKELEKYFNNLNIPKYYNIKAEPIDEDNSKFVIIGYVDTGDVFHDHKYFDDKAKEFFENKDIEISIYEPQELMDREDDDNIYTSGHVIQRPGDNLYPSDITNLDDTQNFNTPTLNDKEIDSNEIE